MLNTYEYACCRAFLKSNLHYDEVLAVNIAGQTKTWKVLHFLATNRGLYPEVLDILLKVKPRDRKKILITSYGLL